jgi:tight adherence protein B
MHLFEQKLRRSGFITVNPYQLMTITVLISLIMALLFYLIFKSDFPILAGIFGGLLPGGIVWITCNQFEYKRKAKILHQMPDVLDAMNRSIRSGLGVTRAIEVAAAEIEDPLRLEFRYIADRLNVGQSLPSVFEEVAAHIDIDDFYFFAMAIVIQHETGGSLSETLTNLSNLIRRRHELRLKIKALSSEARASALIVGSLPFLASLGLSILNPEHLQPFITHSKGHTLLIIAAFMMSLGIVVIRRMIQFRM